MRGQLAGRQKTSRLAPTESPSLQIPSPQHPPKIPSHPIPPQHQHPPAAKNQSMGKPPGVSIPPSPATMEIVLSLAAHPRRAYHRPSARASTSDRQSRERLGLVACRLRSLHWVLWVCGNGVAGIYFAPPMTSGGSSFPVILCSSEVRKLTCRWPLAMRPRTDLACGWGGGIGIYVVNFSRMGGWGVGMLEVVH